MKLGAIEAGGTKFVCGVGDDQGKILLQQRIPTTTPAETMAAVIDFFKQNPVAAIGVGSFGPIGVNTNHRDYGFITHTPKQGWRDYNLLGTLRQAFNLPVYWTTDVNVAAYGEYAVGAAKDVASLVYFTVGTGIGAGVIYNDQFLQGYSHPEAGHILLKHHPDDEFEGICPYHGDCLEGLASGPAIEARYHKSAKELTNRKDVWELEAFYLAQACVNYTLSYAPDRIVIGGGVMHQKQLFNLIRNEFKRQLADYATVPALKEYIQPIKLHDDGGIIGCVLLAKTLVS